MAGIQGLGKRVIVPYSGAAVRNLVTGIFNLHRGKDIVDRITFAVPRTLENENFFSTAHIVAERSRITEKDIERFLEAVESTHTSWTGVDQSMGLLSPIGPILSRYNIRTFDSRFPNLCNIIKIDPFSSETSREVLSELTSIQVLPPNADKFLKIGLDPSSRVYLDLDRVMNRDAHYLCCFYNIKNIQTVYVQGEPIEVTPFWIIGLTSGHKYSSPIKIQDIVQ